ncbi:MAG: hypothetical protein JNM80_01750 [Phycisphaerae bacterium]|nr:hypothetical protein [Phycisphaerae bacterium]
MLDATRESLASLPLWAQALVAVRMARRVALALLAGADLDLAHRACDAIEACAAEGDGTHRHKALFGRLGDRRGTSAAFESLWLAADSACAAEAANDFPVDAIVTASAWRSIAAAADDPRISRIQVAVLLAADLDLVRFACAESGVQTYAGLGPAVLSRLTPTHPLTPAAPPPSPESHHR